MSLLVEEERKTGRRPISLQEATSQFLDRLGRLLEGNGRLCYLLIALLYFPLAIHESHTHMLFNDEIFTYRIAEQPTMRRLFSLAREIDLHPPLHYLVQRMALHLPLPRWLGSRLPSILAGGATLFVLFHLVARRLGRLLGLVAVMVFSLSPAIDWAWDNRPYMLWLCSLALLLWAWESATSGTPTWRSRLAVFAAALAMTASHLIGIACVLPFVMAEAVRLWRRQRTDWPLWIALVSPASIGMGYFYQMRNFRGNSFPLSHLPSVAMGWFMYRDMVADFFFILSICVVVSCYIRRREAVELKRPLHLRREEAVLLGGLFLLPLLLLFVGWELKIQFWTRYGSCAVLSLSLLIPWMLYRRAPRLRTLTVLLVLSMTCYIYDRLISEVIYGFDSPAYYQTGRRPIWLSQLDPKLPIVDASPMTYMEMTDRESPAIVRRVYYLTDRSLAYHYSGYTLFENEGKIHDLLQLPSHTAPFGEFLAGHRSFYMIGNYNSEQDWLPRALVDKGMTVRYLGKFVSTYQDDDVFLVSAPGEVLTASR